MTRTFDEPVAEAEAAPGEGWDFSWLHGRATDQRPSWSYRRMVSRHRHPLPHRAPPHLNHDGTTRGGGGLDRAGANAEALRKT